MDWAPLTDFVKTVGVPAALLFYGVYAFFKYVAVPLTRTHMTLVESLVSSTVKQAANDEAMMVLQRQQAKIMDDQAVSTERIAAAVRDLQCAKWALAEKEKQNKT